MCFAGVQSCRSCLAAPTSVAAQMETDNRVVASSLCLRNDLRDSTSFQALEAVHLSDGPAVYMVHSSMASPDVRTGMLPLISALLTVPRGSRIQCMAGAWWFSVGLGALSRCCHASRALFRGPFLVACQWQAKDAMIPILRRPCIHAVDCIRFSMVDCWDCERL